MAEEGDLQVCLGAYCTFGTSCLYFSLNELSGTPHASDTDDREVTTTRSRPVLLNLHVLSNSSTASGTRSSEINDLLSDL